ncbi:MAG: tetratricopeptide repeat protein [Gammaproteobacteria bacterium]
MTNDNKSLIDDAVLMFAMGDEIKSEELLLKVLESDPANIDALRAVSEVSLSLGKIDQAELHCRQAVKQDPDDLTSIVSLARILVKKGDKEGAEEASARARILGWKEELNSDVSESI